MIIDFQTVSAMQSFRLLVLLQDFRSNSSDSLLFKYDLKVRDSK